MDVSESEVPEKCMVTKTLNISANILAQPDTEDETWSWGLSPRIVQISKDEHGTSPLVKTTSDSGQLVKKNSEQINSLQNINER